MATRSLTKKSDRGVAERVLSGDEIAVTTSLKKLLGFRATAHDVLGHLLESEEFECWAVVRFDDDGSLRSVVEVGPDRGYWKTALPELAEALRTRVPLGGSFTLESGTTVAVPIPETEKGPILSVVPNSMLVGTDRRPLAASRALLEQLHLHARLLGSAFRSDESTVTTAALSGIRDETTGCFAFPSWCSYLEVVDRFATETGRDVGALVVRVTNLADVRASNGRVAADELLREVAYSAQYVSGATRFARLTDDTFAAVRVGESPESLRVWQALVLDALSSLDAGSAIAAVSHRRCGVRRSLAATVESALRSAQR